MKTARQIPARDIGVLKQAAHDAVVAAGGVKAVAEALSYSPARVSEAASPFHGDRWFHLLHMAEIEAMAGKPVFAEALARLSGFGLVPLAALTPKSMGQHLADVIAASNAAEGSFAMAMVDGAVDRAEAESLITPVARAIEHLQHLDAQLRHSLKAAKS